MGSNVIVGIVIVIVILAVVAYLISYFMKKKNQERLASLESRKEALFDLPVIEEVDEVKKMHLVGQSQNTFREWNQRWSDISTKSFAELEGQIFEVENLNDTFRFLKAKTAIVEAENTMIDMEAEVDKIREGLKELQGSEERNSDKVQEALDAYGALKEKLKEDKESFGPAYSELQKQLKNVEIEFTQFVTLNSSGDPIEASEVLNKAETHTYDVEAIMDQIPGLYEELHEIFPGQLKEINDSYDRLLAEDYVIPEEDFEENITKAEKRVENSLRDLEKIEIDTVEVANRDTASAIDELYDIMEREMNAKKYVTTNRHTLREYIDHATKNNRQLMIELDHTSQSYVLNHNELGRARGFQTEIDELSRRHHQVETQLDAHQLPYSEVQRYFKESFKVLDDIENQQVEIDDSLHELRTGEQAAQEKVETFEFTLRNLKRFVEKQRLPGLPGDYLEFFFVATDRVEELSGALNKIRIDMEDVNRLVKACQEDLAQLDQKTTELVDDAALTEQMMQYANRYRHTHQEIKTAIDTSLNLFSKEYHYHAALTTIGDALEKAEPGAYKRIENFYFNNRDLV